MKKVISVLMTVVVALIFINNPVHGQALSHPLGNVKSIKKIADGIILQTDFGNLKATIYTPDIIKISITKNPSFDDFSYAVATTPDPKTKFTIIDEKQDVTVTTDSLRLVIGKNPVRVSLYNKSDKLINGDDPAFGTSWVSDEITTYKKLFADERFIGLGEKVGDLDRRGNAYVNWNTDAFGYSDRTDPLYCSIPFYIGIHDSIAYGIFLDNSSRTHFNFGASQNRFSSFAVEAGDMNYFLIGNSTVAKIIESYTWLTGRMPLPPMWSLGYHQCRYSYYPDSKVLDVAQTFREKKIPCDVLWFDIHYMQDYKVFTWNHDRFPDPKRMMDKLDDLGFKNVSIIDPGIKAEPGYFAYDDGLKKNSFLKYSDGTVYSGAVWPGWCAFTDYTKPEARQWWGSLFRQNIEDGLDGFWCDMNEVATWGQSVPSNVLFNFEGHPSSYRMGKNVFGFQMARATFEGTKDLLHGKRPFVLTRAGYAGLQRYTAIWTGDNLAEEGHMLLGVRLVSSLGLSGVSFAGYDVGGFAGEASPDLMARWISVGAFCPFFRAHKVINARDAEPWSFGEKTEQICRSYIQLRYNLLPYVYSAFYESTQTGMPVQRSLAINYTNDPKIYEGNAVNEYLFGPSMLVVPCITTQPTASVYLPEGTWYDLYTENKFSGNTTFYEASPVDQLPVFIKAGSIIPQQSAIQTTAQKPDDTLNIHVYQGTEKNSFTYYEDAGDGYDYSKGEFYKREITLDGHQLIFSIADGSFPSHFKFLKIFFHGFQDMQSVDVNGTPTPVRYAQFSFLQAPGAFDPLGGKQESIATRIQVASFPNAAQKMLMRF